jgi:hypothetical protein
MPHKLLPTLPLDPNWLLLFTHFTPEPKITTTGLAIYVPHVVWQLNKQLLPLRALTELRNTPRGVSPEVGFL